MSTPLEEMRRRWDPVMAGQIAAHVTLVYPWEARDPAIIGQWLRRAVAVQAPFRLIVQSVDPSMAQDGGCTLRVLDADGGYAAIRSAIVSAEFTPGNVSPHVTIVHPRTSDLGREASARLLSEVIDIEFWVFDIAVTAWDGERWSTLELIPLGG